MLERARAHRRLLIVLSFACIWLVWGSTFLSIRLILGSIPPLLLCGLRLVLAGVLLVGVALVTRQPLPRGAQWGRAALVGILLPGMGNATVSLGVAHLTTGLVALLVATIPLWMALFGSFGPGAERPTGARLAGLVMGFAGVVLLIGPRIGPVDGAPIDLRWALVPVVGSLSWAWGSMWSRRVELPSSGVYSTAIGAFAAGAAHLTTSVLAGDLAHWSPAAVPWAAWAGLVYLAVFGTVLGFGAYLYLLKRVSPAVVATYAFVNPVVAMTLGSWVLGESLTGRTFSAAALVLGAVVLITFAPARSVMDARGRGR
jgi:drug/metabolite transporter (DMT)-like permease